MSRNVQDFNSVKSKSDVSIMGVDMSDPNKTLVKNLKNSSNSQKADAQIGKIYKNLHLEKFAKIML